MKDRYQQHVNCSLTIYTDNLGTSVTKAYNVDDIPLDSKDLELTSMGDAEAFNPLADLTGDYHGHIRSLLYGQLFNGLSLSAVARFRPFWWLPRTMQPVSCEQNNYRDPHSAPLAYGYLPHANGSLRERHPQIRSSEKVSDCLDQFNRHGQSNGSYTASDAKSKENDSLEVMPEKGESQHERRLDEKHLSLRSVGNENAIDVDSSGTWKIEFGSIGNLVEEVLLAEKQSKTAVMEQDRFVEGEAIHLNSEAEFPPLGL